jgi:hypothetical protein
MDWFTQLLLSIGQARVSLAKLGLFLVVVVFVVAIARTVGSLVSTRLLARTSMDRGLQYAIGRMTYYALLVLGLMVALQTSGIEVGSLTVILGAPSMGPVAAIRGGTVPGAIISRGLNPVAVGWVVKRAVIRILIWLRLDRLGGRVGWRAAFGKGDVRAALYNLLGGIAMLLVLLIFLDNALQILGLTVLSRMVDQLVFYLPNLGVAGLIVGIGIFLANVVAERTEDILEGEEFDHTRLMGKILKGCSFPSLAPSPCGSSMSLEKSSCRRS